MRPCLTHFAALLAAGCIVAFPARSDAQAFADLKSALVDYSIGDAAPKASCEALAASFKAKDVVSLKTRAIAAAGGVPAHCRVSGVLSPEIGFEVNLPAKWNRRLYMIGNGGLAGEQPDDAARAAQRAGALGKSFVMVSTDTGHKNTERPNGVFAQRNPQTAIDYAYRAVHLTLVTARSIADAYY